jgi:glycine oxidase
MRVGVVGGGIIGLACAWRLAQAGARVELFDASSSVREASWAAAGMLAPHNEASVAGDLWRLGCASLARWPEFVRDLAVNADEVDLRERGSLLPVFDETERAEAGRRADFLAAAGVAVSWLDGHALRWREPHLSSHLMGAMLFPGGQVNPRLVTTRLIARCAALGVVPRIGVAVESCRDGVVVTVDGIRTEFDQVVLACGAWTPDVAHMSGLTLMGEPVKGQMLRFAAPDGLLDTFVHSHHAYLVPRRGQGLVVGATMVEAGFDRSEDAAAIAALAAGARRLLPALEGCEVVETWTGFRPRLRHGNPLIGRTDARLVVASGHFRNGILLAPITADAATGLVLGRPVPTEALPFGA